MKKDQKNRKNPLRVTLETLRHLDLSELTEVRGGAVITNNGCGSGGSASPTFCLACNV